MSQKVLKNRADREAYYKEIAHFNIKAGHFVSIMLIVMEAAMLVYALATFDFKTSRAIEYTVLYVILLCVGITVYLLCLFYKNRLDTGYRSFNIIVLVFSVVVLSWGAVLSSLDISNGYYPIIFFSFMTGFSAIFYLTDKMSMIIISGEMLLFYILNLTLAAQPFDFNILINYLTYFFIIAAVIWIKERQSLMKFKTEMTLKNKDIQLNEMVHKLNAMNKQLIDKAVTDRLTGAYNRWAFNNNIKVLINNCIKNNTSLTAIMYDIDSFKYVNDIYGHVAGDSILKSVCNKLVKHTHKNCVYRFGGEEFVVLLENMDAQKAFKLADSIREDIAGEVYTDKNIAVTISGGIYTDTPVSEDQSDEFWIKADSALYKAKHSGKNCIVSFNDTAAPVCLA